MLKQPMPESEDCYRTLSGLEKIGGVCSRALKDRMSQFGSTSLASRTAVILLVIAFLAGTAAATDLLNIESIHPAGDGDINITGDVKMPEANISGFFGPNCPTGETVVDIQSDGTLECVSVASEVQDDFVQKSGDTMGGTLDMNGNPLTDTTGPLTLGGGQVDVSSGNLDLNGNSLTQVNKINGQSVSSLGGDGYIGNSTTHTAGGNLDMNGNSITSSGGEICVGQYC